MTSTWISNQRLCLATDHKNSCELEDLNGEKFLAAARNNRLAIFTFEKPYKLLVPGNQFLNNYSFLPADKNVVGYLCFDGNIDRMLDIYVSNKR